MRVSIEPAELALLGALAEDDPARALVAEILSVVRVSHWSLARFKGGGWPDELLSSSEREDNRRAEFEELREEFFLQRELKKSGPTLTATLRRLHEPYVSGITLVFANRRREFGTLSLLRTEALGSFTSVEVQALALALDSSADRLTGLSVADDAPEASRCGDFGTSVMHVLDKELNVVLTGGSERRNAATAANHKGLPQRLPAIIEQAVRELIVAWSSDPARERPGVSHPVSFLTVRAQPLLGISGPFVGVLLERPAGGELFDKAARSFRLSPRELEALALLLEGATLNEIADKMQITSSTVQDHIKSMLGKTESRNRSELIAKVLRPRRS